MSNGLTKLFEREMSEWMPIHFSLKGVVKNANGLKQKAREELGVFSDIEELVVNNHYLVYIAPSGRVGYHCGYCNVDVFGNPDIKEEPSIAGIVVDCVNCHKHLEKHPL